MARKKTKRDIKLSKLLQEKEKLSAEFCRQIKREDNVPKELYDKYIKVASDYNKLINM